MFGRRMVQRSPCVGDCLVRQGRGRELFPDREDRVSSCRRCLYDILHRLRPCRTVSSPAAVIEVGADRVQRAHRTVDSRVSDPCQPNGRRCRDNRGFLDRERAWMRTAGAVARLRPRIGMPNRRPATCSAARTIRIRAGGQTDRTGGGPAGESGGYVKHHATRAPSRRGIRGAAHAPERASGP